MIPIYAGYVSVFVFKKDWDTVNRLLARMKEEEVPPTGITYHEILHALVRVWLIIINRKKDGNIISGRETFQ